MVRNLKRRRDGAEGEDWDVSSWWWWVRRVRRRIVVMEKEGVVGVAALGHAVIVVPRVSCWRWRRVFIAI